MVVHVWDVVATAGMADVFTAVVDGMVDAVMVPCSGTVSLLLGEEHLLRLRNTNVEKNLDLVLNIALL